MHRVFRLAIVVIGITIAVIVINVTLFSLFPVLHRLFTEKVTTATTSLRPKKVIMSYKKPEEKKQVPKERMVRRVANPHRSSSTSRFQFKFTPDLSVEGTEAVAMAQQELAAVVFEEGETDEAAVPLYQPPIPYPDRARDLEIEGILEVIIVIDTKGKVSSIEVVRSPHVSITKAARKVIDTWRFKPARNKGVPVRLRARQVIEFTLE